VRERLTQRFGANTRIEVLQPEDLGRIPDGSLDLIVANSVAQYLSLEELRDLLAVWREKLISEGRLVLADVVPHEVSPLTDAKALLSFAFSGGFLTRAVVGLARTAVSDYRKLRNELGLSRYGEIEMIELLRDHGFRAERRPQNMGHNQARMTFIGTPSRD
jgi:hypothetical protein